MFYTCQACSCLYKNIFPLMFFLFLPALTCSTRVRLVPAYIKHIPFMFCLFLPTLTCSTRVRLVPVYIKTYSLLCSICSCLPWHVPHVLGLFRPSGTTTSPSLWPPCTGQKTAGVPKNIIILLKNTVVIDSSWLEWTQRRCFYAQ
jgi:hypothetical protein